MTSKRRDPTDLSPSAPALPAWRTFEQAVAAVQKLLSPNAIVRHNEYLIDKIGSRRQFDVTIRGEWAGFPALGVVECKRKSRPVGKHEIEAFYTKAQSVNANFQIIFSSCGFYKEALNHARYYNVGAMSLLDSGSQASFALCGPAYARIHRWSEIQMRIDLAEGQTFFSGFDPNEVLFEGKKIIDWFLRELSTTHVRYNASKTLSCHIQFDNPIEVCIKDEKRALIGVHFNASRAIAKKIKMVKWAGDAFYDWHRELLIWPDGGFLMPDFVIDNAPGGKLLNDWGDLEGDITEDTPNFICVNLDFYKAVIDPDTPVLDLLKL